MNWEEHYIELTIANGNCKSIKSEMAGNIMSDVRGCSDVMADTTKELNATKSGTSVQRQLL